MSSESYLLSVIKGERRGPDAAVLRGAMAGLSLAYNGGLKLFFLPYNLGIRKRTRLSCPVISVGNLTVGGTGKTPTTQLICEFLRERGIKVCVLSRGYRGANEFGTAIVSTEKRVELEAKEAGDEAYLLAKLLPGVPVIVGKDRRISGALAIERFKPDVIILDDGMQYYWLHRDLEIVLVDALCPFDNGWTFPRGLLREPPTHLRRGHAVVLTNVDKAGEEQTTRLRARINTLAPGLPTYTAQYSIQSLRALDRSPAPEPNWLQGRRVASFCALGNPSGFEEQLENAGATLVHRVRFPDHHAPTMGELNELIAAACAQNAEAIVVTEKDAVKLPPLGRPLPFYALVVRQKVEDETAFFMQILKTLR